MPSTVNRWLGITYVADNPRMETPPEWFLGRLHDYDAELVVLPSRYKPYAYVIARRSRLGRRGLTGNAIADTITQPDTLMCMRYGCVPVCLMFKHGPQWSVDGVLAKLRARDLWAAGGAEKAADQLEADEAAAKAKQDADKRDELMGLGREAYRSYKMRTGQRVVSAGHSRPGAANTNSPSNSTAATGIILTDAASV
jgi:hypothetical protein